LVRSCKNPSISRYSYHGCRCLECTRLNTERAYRWRKKNPNKHSNLLHKSNLKLKFGITIDNYEEMLRDQHGRCAICRCLPKNKRLAVDHCHKTGAIRGLLCASCNQMLGRGKDNSNTFKRAIQHLKTVWTFDRRGV